MSNLSQTDYAEEVYGRLVELVSKLEASKIYEEHFKYVQIGHGSDYPAHEVAEDMIARSRET